MRAWPQGAWDPYISVAEVAPRQEAMCLFIAYLTMELCQS